MESYIKPAQVAEHFPTLTAGALAQLRYHRKGPRYFKPGSRVLYRLSDIERWVEDHAIEADSDLHPLKGGPNGTAAHLQRPDRNDGSAERGAGTRGDQEASAPAA